MRVLKLRYFMIEEAPVEIFEWFPLLEQLDLRGNPFQAVQKVFQYSHNTPLCKTQVLVTKEFWILCIYSRKEWLLKSIHCSGLSFGLNLGILRKGTMVKSAIGMQVWIIWNLNWKIGSTSQFFWIQQLRWENGIFSVSLLYWNYVSATESKILYILSHKKEFLSSRILWGPVCVVWNGWSSF